MSKKICCVLVFLLIFAFCLGGCSKWRAPKDGVWHCADLGISINFSYIYENRSPSGAKLYENGEYTDILCLLDYGTGIFLTSKDQQTTYLSGVYYFKNDTLTVTNYDGTIYTFVKTDAQNTGK